MPLISLAVVLKESLSGLNPANEAHQHFFCRQWLCLDDHMVMFHSVFLSEVVDLAVGLEGKGFIVLRVVLFVLLSRIQCLI